ncbi:MAG: hypothetical protein AAB250_05220, partial [Bdellovibrionota bacterium]
VGSLASGGSITNSFAVSAVTGSGGSSTSVGVLAGTYGGSITNSYYWSGAACDADGATGGTQACNTISTGSQAAASSFYSTTTQPLAVWDFQNETAVGLIDEWASASLDYPTAWYVSPSNTGIPFFDGNGTTSDPYLVSSVATYNLISSNPRWMSKSFKLTANLSFATVAPKQIGSLQTPFYGTFEGNGKTLSNMNIGTPMQSFVGVFGASLAPSQISNLTIASSTITASDHAGGLVGYTTGAISGVTFAGTMTVGSTSGGLVGLLSFPATLSAGTVSALIDAGSSSSSVGGLVGSSTGVITKSISASTLSGGTLSVGGLVGSLEGGTVTNSYTSGVYGFTSANRLGGLVGSMSGGAVVSNSYSAATVSNTTENSGGLVGYTAAGTSIVGSFAVGNTTGDTATTLVGLLVGGHAGTMTTSWVLGTATCTPGTGTCNSISTGTAGAITDFYNSSNAPISSWDFTTIWKTDSVSLPTHR